MQIVCMVVGLLLWVFWKAAQSTLVFLKYKCDVNLIFGYQLCGLVLFRDVHARSKWSSRLLEFTYISSKAKMYVVFSRSCFHIVTVSFAYKVGLVGQWSKCKSTGRPHASSLSKHLYVKCCSRLNWGQIPFILVFSCKGVQCNYAYDLWLKMKNFLNLLCSLLSLFCLIRKPH